MKWIESSHCVNVQFYLCYGALNISYVFILQLFLRRQIFKFESNLLLKTAFSPTKFVHLSLYTYFGRSLPVVNRVKEQRTHSASRRFKISKWTALVIRQENSTSTLLHYHWRELVDVENNVCCLENVVSKLISSSVEIECCTTG